MRPKDASEKKGGRKRASLENPPLVAMLRQAVEGGYTGWDDPQSILTQWKEFDGSPEYEAIVAGLREQAARVEQP